MMTWTLVICIGVSSFGCGVPRRIEGLDKATCFEAAAAAKVDGVNSVAYCIPEKK